VAAAAGILGAVALGFAANEFIRADVYTARTQVWVAVNQPIVFVDTGSPDPQTYQRRQAALVRSRHVLQAAIDRPGVSDLTLVRGNPDPVGWLENALKADFFTPEILRITLDGKDAGELTALLDALREAYLQVGVNKEVTDKKAARDRLVRFVEEEKVKLEAANLDVRSKAEEFRVPDLLTAKYRHQANQTRVGVLQTRLFELESQVKGCEETLVDLEAHPPTRSETAAAVRPADLDAAVVVALGRDPDYQAARAEVAQLEAECIEARRVAAKGTRPQKLIEKEAALQQARDRMAAREKAVRDEAARKLAADSGLGYDVRLREYEARLAELRTQTGRTRGERNAVATEHKRLDAANIAEARGINDLDRLSARVTEVEARIKAANSKAENLEAELAAPPRAQTHEPAVITQVPNPSKKTKMVAAAVAVGFLAGLAGIVYLDLRTARIDSPDTLDRHLHTGVVGCVPRTDAATIAALTRPDGQPLPAAAALCDAVDACRALLLNALPTGRSRVIMIASGVAGEGKTSLSAQLALSLGRAGYRTLLIDGDMRKPTVHTLFGRTPNPGLAEALRRTASVDRIVRRSPLPNLHLLPAGVCHPNEAVSLLQLRMASVLRKCKPHFDVILIDTPPLSLPDAMIIGRQADGTILSLMNHTSTLPAAQAACARLRAMNIPLLGAVLNGVRESTLLGYGY
jgi:capsular exopolysaccharide synthesis family protein